jgi:hypothetical protein
VRRSVDNRPIFTFASTFAALRLRDADVICNADDVEQAALDGLDLVGEARLVEAQGERIAGPPSAG